jgi:hypothetical protein
MMVCCAKAARGEISHHEIRTAATKIRMHKSGMDALLCTECRNTNFEVDPFTKIARAKGTVELFTAHNGGHEDARKRRH